MAISVTPLAEILHGEIARTGPIPFSRFMQAALYDPRYGYYGRERDPFGTAGDFFTAEQLQPVFGRLIAQCLEQLASEMRNPPVVVELGAGRREMEPHLGRFDYRPVDVGYGSLPGRFTGFIFANEFFDALPVDVVVMREGELREVRVGASGGEFAWVEAGSASAEAHAFVRDAAGTLEEGTRIEVNLAALDWIGRMAASLESGYALVIDYGYTKREAVRFPEGTLMGYRKHRALDDVLRSPGEQDITAHVAFSALEIHAERCGFHLVRTESMASALLRTGEADQFAAALAAADEREAARLRLQLKTLLFGMGESFRTLLWEK